MKQHKSPLLPQENAPAEGPGVVMRRLSVPALQNEQTAQSLRDCLGGIEGVTDVQADPVRRHLRVRYDTTQVALDSLVQAIQAAGFPPARGFRARIRIAWYRYLDDNIRANVRACPSPSCHNTKEIFARRR